MWCGGGPVTVQVMSSASNVLGLVVCASGVMWYLHELVTYE